MSLEISVVRRSKWATEYKHYDIIEGGGFKYWKLLPSSYAKPQPDYIPEILRQDYEEACAIRDLIPTARTPDSRGASQAA